MKFTVENVAYASHSIEVTVSAGIVHMDILFEGDRHSINRLTRKQALILAGALQTLAWSLDEPTNE